jgi:uncharacterized protein YndB with AHSA1/START domain
MERTFDAPRSRVFEAWTSCDALRQWWGPAGWTLPICEIDFRPGGTWFYGMQGPADDPQWASVVSYGLFTYQEIVAPVLLVAVDEFVDADRQPLPDMPATTITIDFVDIDGRTRIINTGRYSSSEELARVVAMGMAQGATETWDRLEAFLRSGT